MKSFLQRSVRKGLGLFLLLAFNFVVAAPYLEVVRDGVQSDTVLLRLDLEEDASWQLRWNHSVTGILVSDLYAYKEGMMLLTDSHTPAFDAGLGHIPGRGRLESDTSHGYWIRDINESVPGNAYALRVGSKEVDHRIVHAGQTYSLSDLVAGERVTLRISP